MKAFATLTVFLLAALPYVTAHGFVSVVKIDGKSYKGNTPGSKKIQSPIRAISTQDPVKGATNPSVSCGQSASAASLVASANPGSKLEFSWNTASMGKWPHNTGPVMTYLAECTGTTCDKFNPKNAKWFKIDQQGKKSDGQTWVQQDLFNGKSVSVSLPSDLKAGDYLVRHEIIALHLATSKGGAEFYPSCTQIRVGGNGQGTPSASEEVTFPGGYSDSDPGIFDPNVFNSNDKYKFPGPAVAKLVAAGTGSSDNGNNSSNGDDNNNDNGNTSKSPSPSPSSAAPQPSKTPSKPSNTGNCKMVKKKRSAIPVVPEFPAADSDFESNATPEEKRQAATAAIHSGAGRRHFSRIMGRIPSHAMSI